jgi:anti-sigma B factor antagonist
MPLLRIAQTSTLDRAVIAPIGELDLGSAPRLHEAIADTDGEHLVIDLRRVEFMDSTGLLALSRAADDATSRGSTFSVIPGPPNVDRLFDLTETRSRFVFVDPGSIDVPADELPLRSSVT